MPFLNDLKTRLSVVLVKLLVQGTSALGLGLLATQRALEWLDGQHPQLAHGVHAVRAWLLRHP